MSAQPEELPEFRRATPEDAIDVAGRMFDHGQRIDMQTLADRLNVSRGTLYRWVGDRDHLIDRVSARRARLFWEEARRDAVGTGLDRYLDAARRFLIASATYEPAVQLANRESALILRIFLDPDSRVASRLRLALEQQLETDLPGNHVPPEVFAAMGLSATALVWANVATGHPPRVDETIELMRGMLRAFLDGHPPAGRLPAANDLQPSGNL